MKQSVWVGMLLVVGVLSGHASAQEQSGLASELAKATNRKVELHGHEHAVSGEVPLDTLPEQPKRPGLPKGLEYGALFEVEAGYGDGKTEWTMATIELGAGWQVADWLHGDVVFLYEEDATDPVELNQLFFTLGNTQEFPFYLQGGKFYVPFGHFDSLFVSDPVVLELGEGLKEGATLGFEKGDLDAILTVFKSKVDGGGDYNGVLAASYGIEDDNSSVAIGASLIYNILDADGLLGVLEDAGYTSADEAAGFNAWLTATQGPVTFIAEYVQVLDRIEMDGTGTGLKPASINLELGYALSDTIEIGVKVERAVDVADWFAKERYGAVGNWTVFESDLVSAGVALEYLHEKFDGDDDADLITLQFALEF